MKWEGWSTRRYCGQGVQERKETDCPVPWWFWIGAALAYVAGSGKEK